MTVAGKCLIRSAFPSPLCSGLEKLRKPRTPRSQAPALRKEAGCEWSRRREFVGGAAAKLRRPERYGP